MKKAFAALALATAMAAAGFIYPDTMEITALDRENDVVTLETATGFIYEMDGCEDYSPGDLVSVLMWSAGTKNVTDDAIISARYSGYYREP